MSLIVDGTTGLTLPGSSSGTTVLQAAASASGTLTLPATTDTLVGKATTDTLTNKTLTAAALGSSTATTQTAGDNSTKVATTAYADAASAATAPQGRLTLTSATPVLTATVSAATTIYYALYTGNKIPVYSGSAWAMTTFTELSNATAQSSTGSAGPAAVANNSNYDLFVWSNSGTLTLTRGPLWTSGTGRGTGAGTTEISRVLGIWSNTVAITNGPGAGLGTYVGTVRSNGSATIDFIFGAAAAGGTASVLGVFNAYNRVPVAARVQDTTSSWAYATNTWRAANASNTNRISYIDGLAEVPAFVAYTVGANGGAGNNVGIGINRDSTSATPSQVAIASAGDFDYITPTSSDGFAPSLGFHYFQAMESVTGSSTFYSAVYAVGVYSQLLSAQFSM